ncbi:MAG: helix-turn-helix transcriptional regulator [Clostridiaceae bacterium]|nr:helix-turn-helix transcriptional regulator [Clostridiaceae bacterium]
MNKTYFYGQNNYYLLQYKKGEMVMQAGIINNISIPTIGFAHHFYTDKSYHVNYGFQKSIEIVYIKVGSLFGELNGYNFEVSEDNFLILFRHLPIRLYTDGKNPHSHCSMQLLLDYDFDFFMNNSNKKSGLILPFVTPSCTQTDCLKKDLFSAISDISMSKDEKQLSSAITGLNILKELSSIYQKKLLENKSPYSILEYQTKKYIASNLRNVLTLCDIAKHLNKTPNYLNYVFKKECGMSIIQYSNKEKIRLICEMIQYRDIPFKVACENVGISDISYAYRMFKKYIGITPKEYLLSHIKTN